MTQQTGFLSSSILVGEKVRKFYDHHPYPPPIESLDQYQRQWCDEQRRRADFLLFCPSGGCREERTILIAGCGTSQAAKHAMRWPELRVIGIDSSAASVHHTEHLKKKYDLKNLEVRQLAIEQVSDLDMSFDQIVCTGVLHHLANPGLGLEALRNALKPDGAMQIMVYAPYGRTGIYMLQEFSRRTGIRATAAGIRDLVTVLRALPAEHPLQTLLTRTPELRNESALADALLHPQDRAYSVPQLFCFIKDAGLTFGRWLRQAPYSIHCGLAARLPHASRIARLPTEEQFAAIELFRGTIARHSAIVYRDDAVPALHTITFGEENWLNYLPVRMADTICLDDPEPGGAAAVLINRTHTYKDLFLEITPTEKKLFEAVDGQSTIAEIAQNDLLSGNPLIHQDLIRNFFERLWWHDQVVFQIGARQ